MFHASEGSMISYLADDVNKVFAKVSKKISRVKWKRFVTNGSQAPQKNHKNFHSSNNDRAGLPNFITVTP